MSRIVRVRKAGKNHQVLSLLGGNPKRYRREPCATCPWRRDAVGVFPAKAFVHSASVAYDAAFSTFACHTSGKKQPTTCAGFLLRNSVNNVSVRIALADGAINLQQVTDGGVELFFSYREMAIANGVSPSNPALRKCRADDSA
jgi:hypothetical protein